MTGRGGRGAALKEALLARQRQPGEAPKEEIKDASAQPVGAAQPVAASIGRAAGRASLLANLSQRVQVKETAVTEAPPVIGGRGRAQMLQLVRKTQSESSSVGSRSPEAPTLEKKLAQVSLREESLEQSRGRREPPVSLQEQPPVHRTGESGKQIEATANYIRLFLEPDKGVFEYEVKFNPPVDNKSFRFKMLGQHIEALGGTRTFDGVILYLPIKMKNEEMSFSCTHPVDSSHCEMKVIYKRKKRLGECIHLYNVLFRRVFHELSMVLIGRQHFLPQNARHIPQHKLEVWPGIVTAIDEYEGGIQLCCDSSHRVLRTQTVHEILQETATREPRYFKDIVQKTLIGSSVMTRYNNKLYRIDDIDWNQNPRCSFNSYSGEEITFQQYYKKQYDINIRDLDQPLLLSRLKKKIQGKEKEEQILCLVPELCYMTGLTDEMRSDFRIMKDIASHTRITPNQRQYALKEFIKNISSSPKVTAMLADWGLSIDKSTIPLMARMLEPENIYFGDNGFHQGTPQADWGASSTRNKVLSAVDLIHWIIIHTQRDARYSNDFASMIMKVGPQMGMRINQPQIYPLRDDRTNTYLEALKEHIRPHVQLVVIIFPSARDDRYSAVKKLCCTELPIASQVINSKTLSRPDRIRSVVQKIALQINCKLGGSLWAVKIPLENFMVCGIDSFHEAGKRGNSVAGFITSLNQNLTKWTSRVCIQGAGQELVDGLKMCFLSALTEYYEENHQLPDRIVIYRDGVGDGQLNVVKEHEVPQFESCFTNFRADYNPKLTVVVCQKRINTRIFASLRARGGGDGDLENPPPGSIVDHTVTRRNWYDFFLVSQHVRQGTVTPTHYIVIHDNCNMKTDHLQRLTYKMCHLYYNWPGTIRVPAPCQYAHKLAQLVGQSIHKHPSEKLQRRLYFL